MNKIAMIEKLEAQAAGERSLGNHDAASAFESKAVKLRRKYNLQAPEPAKQNDDMQRLKQEEYWESLKPATEVVVEVLLPGMSRTVNRVVTMDIALPLLKCGSANFVRLAHGSNEFTFRKQEVADQPREKSIWL
jgi:hypothetical protein